MDIINKLKSAIDIKKILKLLGILLIFFLSGDVKVIVANVLNYDVNNLTPDQLFTLTAITDAILVIVLCLIYLKDLRKDFKLMKKDFNKNTEVGFKYWIVGLIVMIVSNLIINIFLKDATATNEEVVQEIIGAAGFVSVIVIGIVGPIIEELVFRKAFRDAIKNKIAFVLISGVIFGGLHVILSISSPFDLFYLIPYCSLGISFGIMYVKTDNIYTSMFMHVFHNTVFTLISLVGTGAILW